MFQVSVEPRLEEICCNLRVVVLWSIAGPLKLCSRQVLGLGSSIGALRCTQSLAPMSVGQNAPVRSTLRGQCIKHASLLGLWYARHSKAAEHCTGRKHQGRPGCAFEGRWSLVFYFWRYLTGMMIRYLRYLCTYFSVISRLFANAPML